MTTRTLSAAVVAVAALAATLAAGGQQPPVPEPSSQTFRASVDVIEVDVSVLDKDRRPVRGLAQSDFTILEGGKPQKVVSFTPVNVADRDPSRSARMSFVPNDTADNSLAERLGDGRLFAIVMDDMNLPPDDADIVIASRDAARHIVEQLGPSDQASVVYVHQAGKTQDFTNDKSKLHDAIDRFRPNPPDWIEPRRDNQSGGGADLPYTYSRVLARSDCMRDQPAVPTLDAVVAALTAVTGKRKTLLFLGPGLPIEFSAVMGCPGDRAAIMKDVFRKAQRASINIHTIDPAGYHGYEQYMENYRIRNGPPGVRRRPPGGNPRELRLMRDFLKVVAENTGGRFVLDTDAVLSGIDRILEEETSYYLLGYEASNNTPDGKFRKIQVKVNRPGVSIRHRSGYWALDPGAVVAKDRSAFNPLLDFDPRDAGLTGPPGVALRAAASAIAIAPRLAAASATVTGRSSARAGAPPAGPWADVVVALSVRWPAIHAPVAETLTIIRNIYDPDGRAGDPLRETVTMTLEPGLERRRELIRRVSLPPGRHQLRFSVASALLGRNGSVYVDVEVPDFSRSALALSNVVLGSLSPVEEVPTDGVLGNPPLRPTSLRDFANGDRIGGYVYVHQAGAPNPVTMTVEVFDAADHRAFMESGVVGADVFDADGGAGYQVALPLDQFKAGPHLLSVAARLPNGRTARRDLVFQVR